MALSGTRAKTTRLSLVVMATATTSPSATEDSTAGCGETTTISFALCSACASVDVGAATLGTRTLRTRTTLRCRMLFGIGGTRTRRGKPCSPAGTRKRSPGSTFEGSTSLVSK
jgi:hypothetical protein